MTMRPSEGLGKRLARFRRLAGLSARELAERSGMGLTRGVVANIESGRKTEITVDQLIALSVALDVPPVVLALPVDEPFRHVQVGEVADVRSIPAWLAMDLFQVPETALYRAPSGELPRETEAGVISTDLVRAVRNRVRAEFALRALLDRADGGDVDEAVLDESRAEVKHWDQVLLRLGATLDDAESISDRRFDGVERAVDTEILGPEESAKPRNYNWFT